ncbi:MAG: hypothetical protein M1828_003874 [Chrysothrix sp. TS-e1954]|nr:MAG: hypothetical protein M1828_003874 [Chrysothrix sp. TS-e1954]
MAKNKKGKKGGAGRAKAGSGKTPPKKSKRQSAGYLSSSEELETNQFSLRSEARNSERERNSAWFSGTSLRNKNIGFVQSSETFHQDFEREQKLQSGENERMFEVTHQPPQKSTPLSLDGVFDAPPKRREFSDLPLTPPQTGPSSGKEDASRNTPKPTSTPPRAASPTPSDSEEEVVLFKGRGKFPTKKENIPTTEHVSRTPISFNLPDFRASRLASEHRKTSERQATNGSQFQDLVRQLNEESQVAAVSQSQQRNASSALPENQMSNQQKTAQELEVVWDTSQQPLTRRANQATSKKTRRGKRKGKGKGREPLDGVLSDEGPPDQDQMQDVQQDVWLDTEGDDSPNEWSRSILGDFDDLSTSDGALEAIEHVLSKRERPSGLQYLVVGQDQSTDDARWVLHSTLIDVQGAGEAIASFEEEERLIQKEIAEEDGDSDGDSSDDEKDPFRDSDGDSNVSDDEAADYLDELDLIERKKDRMTDEHIARLLSKQEELGLGSDDIVLFDGDDEDDSEELDADFLALSSGNNRRQRRKRENRSGFKQDRMPTRFRSFGSNLADPSDMLDGEDYPTYAPVSGARPTFGQPTFSAANPDIDVPDPVVRDLQQQWEADRKKKAAKKAQREELRAEGLITNKKGKSKNGASMQAPYALDTDQLRDDLADFLNGNDQQLALPPMPKPHRKAVHTVAASFGLSSKSAKSGKNRAPVLYKTQRTARSFDQMLFSRVARKITNPHFNGRDGPPAKGKKRFGGGVASGAGVLEGEIVGAAASEIGKTNKGFGLLSKMGWSQGQALGTPDNKGRLMPVEHVVRMSRAGLG